jgi:hypothetical protein
VEEIKTQSGEVLSSFEDIKKEASLHYGNIYKKVGRIEQGAMCAIYLSHSLQNFQGR